MFSKPLTRDINAISVLKACSEEKVGMKILKGAYKIIECHGAGVSGNFHGLCRKLR